jgi:hypothetical protein
MGKWLGLVALACFAHAASDADAAELLNFAEPNLGIPWNAQADELAGWLPGLKQSSYRSAMFRGPVRFGTIDYSEEGLVLSFDADNRLRSIYAGLPNADALRIIDTLNKNLGPGRTANYPDGRIFQHVHEWRSPGYNVNFRYVAVSAAALSEPTQNHQAALTLMRDTPARSEVDAALEYPKLVESMRKQILETQRKQKEERDTAETVPPPTPTPINAATQPALRKAESTWGTIFNPAGDAPLDAFKAYYINTDRPRVVIAQEQVSDVAINYAWDEFHGIKSEDFGAYWVGRMRFKAPQTRLIGVNQSQSKTRIVIDGMVVFEGSQDASVPFEFSKGEHLVEVELTNNWHTTELRVAFGKNSVPLSKAQLRGELERRGIRDVDVHYVGLYESKAKDLSVTLNVGPLERNTVLVLSSYSAIKWIVAGRTDKKLRAIVIASSSPGGEVIGVNEQRTAVLPHRGMIGSYTFAPTCHCTAGKYYCETSDTLLSTRKSVEEIANGRMVGFTVAYGATTVSIPDKTVTEATLEQSRQEFEADTTKRQQCEKKADPDFERMMK